MQLTANQRLTKAAVAIMRHDEWRYIAGVLMLGKLEVVDADHPKIQTACTDGLNSWYNEGFVDKLSDKQLRFLRLHEELHKAFRHLVTWRWMWKKDPKRANHACDHVINIVLVDSDPHGAFILPPPNPVHDPKYRGWDAARIFNDLEDEGGGQGGQGSGDSGDGFDTHDWEGAEAMTAEEEQAAAQEVDRALRQGALAAGASGSGGPRAVGELLEPQVRWQDVLRDFVQQQCAGAGISTYRRPNRRWLHRGMYLPSSVSETVGELVIGADMSGSIAAELPAMFTEIRSVLNTVQPSAVRLLYWDTEVCQDEVYRPDQYHTILHTTKPKGGGGTTPACVPAYMVANKIKPQCVIMLTDGHIYDSHGDWDCPVLWVSIDNKSFTSPTGKVVHVNS